MNNFTAQIIEVLTKLNLVRLQSKDQASLLTSCLLACTLAV